MDKNEFLQEYKGKTLTYKEAADILGLAIKTLQNTKKSYEEAGVTLVSKVKSKTVSEVAKIRVLANTICNLKGLPWMFTKAECEGDQVLPGDISLKDITQELQEALMASFLPVGVKERVCVTDLAFIKSKSVSFRASDEELESIAEVFQRSTSFTPTPEQRKCVYYASRFLLDQSKDATAQIQSYAGTSKSTCIKAVVENIKSLTGVEPLVVSTTHRALEDFTSETKTVAKMLNDLIGASTIGEQANIVATALTQVMMLFEDRKIPYLIVDEYSTIPQEILEALKLVAHRVLFVGDSEQLSRGTLIGAPVLSMLTEQFRFVNSTTDLQTRITSLIARKKVEDIDDLISQSSVATFTGTVLPEKDGRVIESKTKYVGHFDHLQGLLCEYKGLDSQIVVYSRAAADEINSVINGSDEVQQGSKVIVISRDYSNPEAIPGTVGSVVEVVGKEALCISLKGKIFSAKLKDLGLAYALTTTVAQGSCWDNVLAVLGTANKENIYRDAYSAITRAAKTLRVIQRSTVNTEYIEMFDFLDSVEGNRNTNLHHSRNVIAKYHTQELGLPAEEVTKVLSSPAPKASKPSTSEPKAAAPAPTGDARYGVIVGNKKFPTAAKVTMTKAQACLKRDRLSRKHSVEVKVAENLHGGNRVVFDLDNALTVKVFAKFLDLTEAYISEDKSSAHIVFTTDEVLRTVHTRAGSDIKGDFLGNAAYQLRIEKSNKVYNGKEAIPLPLDEYHKFIALLKGDIRVEQVL